MMCCALLGNAMLQPLLQPLLAPARVSQCSTPARVTKNAATYHMTIGHVHRAAALIVMAPAIESTCDT